MDGERVMPGRTRRLADLADPLAHLAATRHLTQSGDASPGATEHNDAWAARQGKLKLDPEIKLSTLDSVASDFQKTILVFQT